MSALPIHLLAQSWPAQHSDRAVLRSLSMHFETPRYYEAADEAGLLLQSAKDISQDCALSLAPSSPCTHTLGF